MAKIRHEFNLFDNAFPKVNSRNTTLIRTRFKFGNKKREKNNGDDRDVIAFAIKLANKLGLKGQKIKLAKLIDVQNSNTKNFEIFIEFIHSK